MLIIGRDLIADNLVGGDGNDTLWGSGGWDTLTGGAGADVFTVLGQAAGTRWSTFSEPNHITDFRPGEGDRIGLIFGGLRAFNAFGGNLAAVAELTAGYEMPAMPDAPVSWTFWVPDSDGAGGWLIADAFESNRTVGPGDFVVRIDFADGTSAASFDPAWFAADSLVIPGTEGSDSLSALAGGSIVEGFGGADSLQGGAGADTMHGGPGADTLDGGDGNDTLRGGYGEELPDYFARTPPAPDMLRGGAGDDTLLGLGLETMSGGAGADLFVALRFFTTYSRFEAMTTVGDFNPGEGDRLSFGPLAGNVLLAGKLPPEAGDRILVLGQRLAPQAALAEGTVLPTLPAGGPVALVHWVPDVARNGGWLVVDLDDDGLLAANDAALRVTFAPGVGMRNPGASWFAPGALGAAGTDADDVMSAPGRLGGLAGLDGNDSLTGYQLRDALLGGAGDDTLDGKGGDDQLSGGEGNDQVWLRAGNDRVAAGYGDDVAFGGSGDDTLIGDEGTAGTALPGGADTLFGGSGDDALTGDAGNDVLVGGRGNDFLAGTAGDDLLLGGQGDDELFGGEGFDTLVGGPGNDTLYMPSANIVFDEREGGGRDLLSSSISVQLPMHIEDLSLSSNLTGVGNAVANFIQGWFGNEELYGMEGDDTLQGLAATDVLVGGLGADLLMGGLGEDLLVFLSVADSPVEAPDAVVGFGGSPGDDDLLDLRAIDADTATPGDDPFAWAPALTGVAGQLVQQVDGDDLLVLGDVDGDGLADLAIRLLGGAGYAEVPALL